MVNNQFDLAIDFSEGNIKELPLPSVGLSGIEVLHALVNEIECEGFQKARVAIYESPPSAKVFFREIPSETASKKGILWSKKVEFQTYLLELMIRSQKAVDQGFVLEYQIKS